MKILFVIPCNGYWPSGIVRVKQYKAKFKKCKVSFITLSYYSPISHLINYYLNKSKHLETIYVKIIRRQIYKFSNFLGRKHISTINKIIRFVTPFFDIVYIQWIIPNKNTIDKIKENNCLIIFDFDDAIFLDKINDFKYLAKNSNLIFAGNNYNLNMSLQYNCKSILLPSCVDINKFENCEIHNKSNEIIIGWIGGESTQKYLSIVKNALINLNHRGYKFKLLLYGSSGLAKDYNSIGIDTIEKSFYKHSDIKTFLSNITIGIMPLYESNWEQGKCAYKLLLYGAAKIPSISTPHGATKDIINEYKNGLLAKTVDDWEKKLLFLIQHPAKRKEYGNNLYDTVLANYSIDVGFKTIITEIYSVYNQNS